MKLDVKLLLIYSGPLPLPLLHQHRLFYALKRRGTVIDFGCRTSYHQANNEFALGGLMLRYFGYIVVLCFVLLAAGCSKKEAETEKPQTLQPIDPTTGMRPPNFVWGSERGQLVNFYFEPTDSLRPIAPAMRNKAEEIYLFCSQMLMFQPTVQIDMYCFKDPPTLAAHTSRNEPFMVENKLYYGYGPAFGRPIAEFVLQQLPQGASRYAFIREGLPVLFDFTSRNYHHAVNNFLIDGMLAPIDTMVINEAYARRKATMREIEASSLCAYILWEWGNEKFMQLYAGTDDFNTTLKNVIGIDTDQLYRQWVAFLPEHTIEKEEEREKQMQQGGGQ